MIERFIALDNRVLDESKGGSVGDFLECDTSAKAEWVAEVLNLGLTVHENAGLMQDLFRQSKVVGLFNPYES